MSWLKRLYTSVIALLAVVLVVPGIRVDNFKTALLAALALGLVNAILRPILFAYTLPINIASLGFFTLLINGFLFFLVSRIVPGFVVASFWSAVWGALVFGIFSFILNLLLGGHKANVSVKRRSRREDVIDVEGKAQD